MRRKDPKYDNAVELYNSGLSIGDLAIYYNITRQAMWKILKRRGCEFRPNVRRGEDNHLYRGGAISYGRTHDLLESAIEKGIVTRQYVCENCGRSDTFRDGRTSVQAHHCDYNKPLEVIWLCQPCHHEWHKNHQAIPFRAGDYGS